MSAVLTGADSLRVFLTGADRDGGDQPDGDASLGLYRAAQEFHSFDVRRENGIPGIVIEFASGMNGFGVGTLESVDGRGVRWAAPGEAFGDAVFLSDGERAIVPGVSEDKFLRVYRNSANPLQGSEVVRLCDVMNNAVGGRDVDQDEPSTGYVRGVALRNVSAGDVTGVKVYIEGSIPERDPATVQVAIQHPSGGVIRDWTADDAWVGAADGLTWAVVYDAPSGLDAGTLSAGDWVGIWISIREPSAYPASAGRTVSVMVQFTDSESTVHTMRLSGRHRERVDTVEQYELYMGVNAAPDFTASPLATFSSLPYGPIGLTPGFDYHCVLRKRNAYDLQSLNTEATIIRVAGDGSVNADPPSGPFHVGIIQNAGDGVAVQMQYETAFDTTRATHWAIWVSYEGVAINVGVAPDYLVAMDDVDFEDYVHSLTGIGSGIQVNVLVRTAIVGASTIYSENEDIYSYEVDGRKPEYLHGYALGGQGFSAASDPYPDADKVVTQVLDVGLNVRVETSSSRARLYVGSDLVWAAVVNGEAEGVYIPNTWHLDTTGSVNESGSSADAVDVDSTDVWFNGRQYLDYTLSTRMMKLDTVLKAIVVGTIDTVTAAGSTHSDTPVFAHDGSVYFQVYDPSVGGWRTYMRLGSDFVLHFDLALNAGLHSQATIEAI